MLKFVTALFIVLLLALPAGGLFAIPKKPVHALKIDTSKITLRKFDANALQDLKKDKDFRYEGESTGEPSAWDIFWNWVWSLITRLINHVPYSGSIIKYLFLGICAAFLVYVILKSVGIDAFGLLRGEAKKTGLNYSETLEDIDRINFDDEIEKAIAKYNYRVAIRLLYLKCLKQLTDKNLIKWQIDKTNAVYLRELTDPQQKQTFGLLTRQFEYVWYGNFAIDKNTFAEINQLFQNFNKQL